MSDLLNEAHYRINALGGVASNEIEEAINETVGKCLAIIEELGGVDPLTLRSPLLKALKPFADLGVGSGPDYETETYRIERKAIREARAALGAA